MLCQKWRNAKLRNYSTCILLNSMEWIMEYGKFSIVVAIMNIFCACEFKERMNFAYHKRCHIVKVAICKMTMFLHPLCEFDSSPFLGRAFVYVSVYIVHVLNRIVYNFMRLCLISVVNDISHHSDSFVGNRLKSNIKLMKSNSNARWEWLEFIRSNAWACFKRNFICNTQWKMMKLDDMNTHIDTIGWRGLVNNECMAYKMSRQLQATF